jgi:hypothetical protein
MRFRRMHTCIEPDAMRRPPILAHRKVMRWSSGRSPGSRAQSHRLCSKTTFPCRSRHSGAGPNPGVLLLDSFTVAGAASALRGVLSTAAHRLPVSPWPPRRLHGAPGHLTTRAKCISRLRRGGGRSPVQAETPAQFLAGRGEIALVRGVVLDQNSRASAWLPGLCGQISGPAAAAGQPGVRCRTRSLRRCQAGSVRARRPARPAPNGSARSPRA